MKSLEFSVGTAHARPIPAQLLKTLNGQTLFTTNTAWAKKQLLPTIQAKATLLAIANDKISTKGTTDDSICAIHADRGKPM